jgi:Na+/melibiose symporter-like transporter
MKKQENIVGNLISGGAMFSLSIFIFQQVSSFSPKAATFPKMLSFVLLVLSLMFIASTLWKFAVHKKALPKVTEEVDSERVSTSKRLEIITEVYPFSIIILCIFFITALNKIGFEISASILILATMALIDRKEAVRKFYVALIVPVALILIFKFGVGLRLPLLLQKLFE